ncbi:MAG: methionine--tRNA ligase [Candidatus Liptonbacteria bacterium]|nr:methionine--tRNA ligase [Candidatus Liptonbacteria bacterium]
MGKFYITTAIDYVNAVPHIGHALEKLQADVLARYHRSRGDETWFLTGTDEHGAKIARAAEAAEKKPEVFTNETSEKFAALKEVLNLSFDDFIRTTDEKRHFPGVELMWKKLVASGDIYKKKYRGLYCVGHEAFVTQKDLVDGKCADHEKEPEVVEEENYFFKLSKYSEEIGKRIRSGEFQIVPEGRKNEILSLIRSGLEDVSFSRPRKDLSWGIPVPRDPEHTIYVWADALTNYLSAIGYGRNEEYAKWWPADVQVVGKDILRFHAAIWPGMLLSARLPLPKTLFVHGFITADGRKMSKTIGNVVDPAALVEKYGTDAVRYYLLREIPSGEDGDYSEKKFKERYNTDLANGIGNFISRTYQLAHMFQAGSDEKIIEKDVQFKAEATAHLVDEKIQEFKLNEALEAIMDFIRFGDGYVNKTEPWKLPLSDASKVTWNLIFIAEKVSELLMPFLPGTADEIAKKVETMKNPTYADGKFGNPKIPPKPLFPRLL